MSDVPARRPAPEGPVYDSARRPPRWIEEATQLWRYRGLVHELVIRDIKVRYKRSVLGILWTMLTPLLNMVALTLVFSAILKQAIALASVPPSHEPLGSRVDYLYFVADTTGGHRFTRTYEEHLEAIAAAAACDYRRTEATEVVLSVSEEHLDNQGWPHP